MRFTQHRYAIIIGTAMIVFIFGIQPGLAAFPPPLEWYHLHLQELPRAVTQDTTGVFDILINGSSNQRALEDDNIINPRNFVETWDGLFQPKVDRIAIYESADSDFKEDGFLLLNDTLPVSSVLFPVDTVQLLRYPIVQVRGDYRQIVYHAERDLRTWIRFTDHADAQWDMLSFNTSSYTDVLSMLYLEMYFTQDAALSHSNWRPDIFYLTPDETRKIYQSPDENAAFEIITPASKTFQGDWKRSRNYSNRLRFAQIRNGFAEVLVDRYPQAESVALGWIKLKEHGYQAYHDYYPYDWPPRDCGRSNAQSIRLFSTEHERRRMYALPDPNTAFREFNRETFQDMFTGRVNPNIEIQTFILDFQNGFVLLGELDGFYKAVPEGNICADEGCGSPCEFATPLGWIPVRDEHNQLTIWPAIPNGWNCTC